MITFYTIGHKKYKLILNNNKKKIYNIHIVMNHESEAQEQN